MGNVTHDNLGNTYSYDAEGRPISAAGATITLDAFGRAVAESGSSGNIVYSPTGWKFALINGSVIKYRDPMPGGLVATQNSDGSAYYQYADWLGSSRMGDQFAGSPPLPSVRYDRAYAPFGEVYAELNGNTENRTFTGPQEDTTPGIDDFQYRQYSASQGRWQVPDPAGTGAVDITNPQTWNRYAYVANNPLSNVDPLGLECGVFHGELIGNCSDGVWAGGSDFGDFSGAFSGIWNVGGVWGGGGWGLNGSGGIWGGGGGGPCGSWCASPPTLLGGNAYAICACGPGNLVDANNQIWGWVTNTPNSGVSAPAYGTATIQLLAYWGVVGMAGGLSSMSPTCWIFCGSNGIEVFNRIYASESQLPVISRMPTQPTNPSLSTLEKIQICASVVWLTGPVPGIGNDGADLSPIYQEWNQGAPFPVNPAGANVANAAGNGVNILGNLATCIGLPGN